MVVNCIPAQQHSLCIPYLSCTVFAMAREAVVDVKPIAVPTIKYEVGV